MRTCLIRNAVPLPMLCRVEDQVLPSCCRRARRPPPPSRSALCTAKPGSNDVYVRHRECITTWQFQGARRQPPPSQSALYTAEPGSSNVCVCVIEGTHHMATTERHAPTPATVGNIADPCAWPDLAQEVRMGITEGTLKRGSPRVSSANPAIMDKSMFRLTAAEDAASSPVGLGRAQVRRHSLPGGHNRELLQCLRGMHRKSLQCCCRPLVTLSAQTLE